MIYFTADYGDRKLLQSMGATFDFTRWQWRLDNPADYPAFSRWLGGKIITGGGLYIFEAAQTCPYCGRKGKVFALGIGEYTEDFYSSVYGKGMINILCGFDKITGAPAEYLRNCGVRKRFSAIHGYKAAFNGCNACGAAFSDLAFFGDEESPFYLDSPAKARALKIKFAPPDGDICLNATVQWSFPVEVLKDAEKEIITPV